MMKLQRLGLNDAVGKFVDCSSKITLGYAVTSKEINELADKFAVDMQGKDLFGIDDTPRPENQRFRRAMFVAGCASLAAEARARADTTANSGSK